MTKQDQFLFIVQTAILANGINLASKQAWAEKYRNEFSANGVVETLAEAIDASDRIPETLSAHEAASEFCNYMFKDLRALDEAEGKKVDCPSWFRRY
jgi:hypothetical protein